MTISWNATNAEALDIFVRFLQIDTSNPPGNEKPAARFLGALIAAEGIACEFIETAPTGRSWWRWSRCTVARVATHTGTANG